MKIVRHLYQAVRTMIWVMLDVICAIRFQLSILFNCLDSTLKLGESPFLGDVNLFPNRNKSNYILNSFHEQNTFWRPGNLNLARRRDSMTAVLYLSEERMLMMGCPIFTRATVPWGFLKAPLIPVWSLYFKLINNFEKHEKFNNFI